MLSNFWRRLTGARDAEPAPVVKEPSEALVAPLSDPAPLARPEPARPNPLVATEETLRRSLQWRSRVLLEGAAREALQSDAPALVESLCRANESVIRQPPTAALQALNLARNPNSALSQIVSLFEGDPMLAQGLLKQANSVYYRRDGSPVTSLNSGVQRVGLQGVQGILTGSLVQTMLCRPGGAYDVYVQQVWSHMQRTAPIARGIAPAFRVDPESAYSLALLHDVGKLIVFDHISTLRHERRRELKIPEMFFRQLLWHLHEPIGGLAVLRWGLGGEAAHVVGGHHRRPAADTPDPQTECVFVAESVELTHANFLKLDWEKIWSAGAISADLLQVQDRLNRMEE